MILNVLAASTAPSWMQGIAAVVLVLLTAATLLVLLRYADDTKRIAEASVSQIENSQMPCLVVINLQGGPNRTAGWAIQNQGGGPALNIRFTGYDGGNRPTMKTIPPLAAKEHYGVQNDIAEVFARWPQDFRMDYESLSGTRYYTTLDMRAEMQTQFHRPPEITSTTTMRDVFKRFWRSL